MVPIDPDDKEAVAALNDALDCARKRGQDDRAIECAIMRDAAAALAGALSWCVEYDGECLGDNNVELHKAKAALRKYSAAMQIGD